ncbi:hypothetical protein FF2_013701 [Malus domestica]
MRYGYSETEGARKSSASLGCSFSFTDFTAPAEDIATLFSLFTSVALLGLGTKLLNASFSALQVAVVVPGR